MEHLRIVITMASICIARALMTQSATGLLFTVETSRRLNLTYQIVWILRHIVVFQGKTVFSKSILTQFMSEICCSWDTNWTLNAVLVKKTTMLSTKYPVSPVEFKSIAQIGLNQWEKQVCRIRGEDVIIY